MDKEEEIIEVELEDDESKAAGDAGEDTRESQDGAQNDDDAHEDDDSHEDDSQSDESESGGEDDDDRKAIRERRRQERIERKARSREREDTMRRELSQRDTLITQMRSELDAIHRRNTGGELAQISHAKTEAIRLYNEAKDRVRVGTEAADGAMVAEATERMYQLRTKVDQLVNVERAYAQRQQQQPTLDPTVANNAKKWSEEHPWYDVRGKDTDSKMVLVIDQQLAEEGWNPATPAYWNELNARVKNYLPHRVNRAKIATKVKSVVAGSGRDTAPSSKGGVFKVSAARVQAIKDMGAWDDPVARNKMIKQYAQYDRDAKNGS